MARVFSIYNNFIAPSGYVVLKDPITIKGKQYTKVWSPFWDIIINKGYEDIPIEEKKDNKKWTWYGVYKEKVIVSVEGNKIVNFFETDVKPRGKDIFSIGGGVKKKNEKIQKKTSSD